ncbi:MAG: VOC family protein [Hyphomonadaceae bacterium]|nr:VOC family protein [Hyphomonadaceae bacterium]
MIGHLSLGVRDLARASAFYENALAPLGAVRVWAREGAIGFGLPGRQDFLALFQREDACAAGSGFHLAFDAPHRAAVDAFHKAALSSGGQDAGAPGLRPHYSETYYAAFVLDPDGYKLEAVHQ